MKITNTLYWFFAPECQMNAAIYSTHYIISLELPLNTNLCSTVFIEHPGIE